MLPDQEARGRVPTDAPLPPGSLKEMMKDVSNLNKHSQQLKQM